MKGEADEIKMGLTEPGRGDKGSQSGETVSDG